MYKKITLRRMQPVTRRYARDLNSLQGILKKLQNLTQDIARLEADSSALLTATRQDNKHANLDEFMQDSLNDKDDPELAKRIDAAEIFYEERLPRQRLDPAPEDILRQQEEATHE